MSLNRHPLLLTCAVLVLLHGCASAPPPPDEDHSRTEPSDWDERRTELAAFDQWTLEGRIAVRQGDRNDTGIIRMWEQDGEDFELRISSSFMGMGLTQIKGDPGHLIINTPDGEQYISDNPQLLIHEAMGWDLPIANLSWWVRGLPAPGDDEFHLYFDEDGNVGHLHQDGWEIYYENHASTNGELPATPRRLTATHGNALVRIAISSWEHND